MKVFLSWSGDRSKNTAKILESWVRKIIHSAEPWMSPDIEKGVRWGLEITGQLERSRVGIICLTRENLNEPWILFEAGALSKTKEAYVCTFLLDLKPSDIEQPLAQFQHTQFDKEDVRKLVHTINQAVKKTGDPTLPDSDLNGLFEILWPFLRDELQGIMKQKLNTELPIRTDREILEEVLSLVRGIEERERRLDLSKKISRMEILGEDEVVDMIFSLLKNEMSKGALIRQSGLDEIDVELALRELLDEGRIEKKGKLYMRTEGREAL